MQVKVEEVSPVEKKVAVEVEWPFVAARLDEAYRELSRGVALKGFRKGKVPRNILERMFARQVEQEVAQKLLQETFVRAAQDHQIQAVAAPIVDDYEMKKGDSFRYEARVEVRAPFEPEGYEGVEVERPEVVVSDEEVERALEHKREEFTEYKKIEGRESLAVSDVVIVDVKGELDGQPFGRDGVMADLSTESHQSIQGLGQALLGAPVGAKDHEVAFASGEGEAAKPARLKITIREAREKRMPPLDDDFAKDTGEADTLVDLRQKLREKLLGEGEKRAEKELKEALLKELVRRNQFPVPASLIDRQADVLVERARFGMAIRGIDYRTADVDEAKLREEMKPAAADEVRSILLLDAIATKEKVEVSDADFEKRLAEMGKERGQNVARVKAELQKEERLDMVRHQLREEKTLDLLLTRANIKSKSSVSPSEK